MDPFSEDIDSPDASRLSISSYKEGVLGEFSKLMKKNNQVTFPLTPSLFVKKSKGLVKGNTEHDKENVSTNASSIPPSCEDKVGISSLVMSRGGRGEGESFGKFVM